jgi:hypothetical protein
MDDKQNKLKCVFVPTSNHIEILMLYGVRHLRMTVITVTVISFTPVHAKAGYKLWLPKIIS